MPRRAAVKTPEDTLPDAAALHAQAVRLIARLYDRAAYAPTDEFNDIMGLVEELRNFTGMHVARGRAPIQASAQNGRRPARLARTNQSQTAPAPG